MSAARLWARILSGLSARLLVDVYHGGGDWEGRVSGTGVCEGGKGSGRRRGQEGGYRGDGREVEVAEEEESAGARCVHYTLLI